MHRRQFLRKSLPALAVVTLLALIDDASAKRRGNRGGRRGGRRGRGRGRRSGFRAFTAKHTGVVKRLGDDADFEERSKFIRGLHEKAMAAMRANGTVQ